MRTFFTETLVCSFVESIAAAFRAIKFCTPVRLTIATAPTTTNNKVSIVYFNIFKATFSLGRIYFFYKITYVFP